MTGGMAMTADLVLPDVQGYSDLQTFVGRAKQIDPAGAVRLAAHGRVLAVYASALHGAGAPTVLAMRVLALDQASEVDATVPLAALTDRFALTDRTLGPARISVATVTAPIRVPLPPVTATGATWAGMVPPRSGWSAEGTLRVADLRQVARSGIAEVAAGTPQIAGAAAVAKLRGAIWGRPLAGYPDLPSGTAFAAETFGFLGSSRSSGGIDADEVFDQEASQDVVTVHRAGRWWRLSMLRGHVLARPTVTLS